MKTLSKILTLGLIISLFPFYGMAETVAEALEATTQMASRTSATFDEGVVINGIRWATRNVDAPGTFAPYPESPGKFFQWNRRKGWSAVGRRVRGWDSSYPIGTKWYTESDPCPEGWRVPTRDELNSLVNAGSEWATFNGINGRLFGIVPYQIFLPAVGARGHNTGTLRGVGGFGFYGSNTQQDSTFALNLSFGRSVNTILSNRRASGFSIRCVKIK